MHSKPTFDTHSLYYILLKAMIECYVNVQETQSFLVYTGRRLRTKDDIHLLMYRSELVVSSLTPPPLT